jgi:hypothetical protein
MFDPHKTKKYEEHKNINTDRTCFPTAQSALHMVALATNSSPYFTENCDTSLSKPGSSLYLDPTKHKLATASFSSGGTSLNNIETLDTKFKNNY